MVPPPVDHVVVDHVDHVGAGFTVICTSSYAVAHTLSVTVRRNTYVPAVVILVIGVLIAFGVPILYVLGPDTFVQRIFVIYPSASAHAPATGTEFIGNVITWFGHALTVGTTLAGGGGGVTVPPVDPDAFSAAATSAGIVPLQRPKISLVTSTGVNPAPPIASIIR